MKRLVFLILTLIATAIGAKAQTITERQELTGALGSGEYAPFWHMANRQGLGSEKRSMGYARVGVGGNHPFSKSGIAIDWDFDMVAGGHMASNVFIQQANIDLTWRELRLSIGQKERWGELMNHRLTSGSLVESGIGQGSAIENGNGSTGPMQSFFTAKLNTRLTARPLSPRTIMRAPFL